MTAIKNPILEGRIFPALTKFSLPILLSLILQALYGAVDLLMVSQFASSADISAVSTGSQTMLIVNGIVTGLSMGITILLGRSVGQQDYHKSANLIGTSIWIFSVMGIFMTVLLLASAAPLASLLHAPPAAYDKTVSYLLICGFGTLFVVSFNVLNGIFCGLGDSQTPLLFVGVACITNIIGDYLLIDLLHMGSTGAAIATILAQAVSVLFCLLMMKKKLPFSITRANMRYDRKLAQAVIRLGLPVALLRMCTEISYLVILGFVNVFGEVASSGVGIAEKLVMFILLIPTAYMSSISAFTAQNMGANQPERAKKCLWVGIVSASAIGSLMSYLSFFHGELMSMLFTTNTEVIAASAEFLQATSIECFVLSISFCFDGYFNGIEKTTPVLLRGAAAALLVRIPYAYYASSLSNASLFQIGMATAFAAIFMLVFCIIKYLITKPPHQTQSNS